MLARISCLGGKCVLGGGDFCQTLVVPRVSVSDIFTATLITSPLRQHVQKLSLHTNERVHRMAVGADRDAAAAFTQWLKDLGERNLVLHNVDGSGEVSDNVMCPTSREKACCSHTPGTLLRVLRVFVSARVYRLVHKAQWTRPCAQDESPGTGRREALSPREK